MKLYNETYYILNNNTKKISLADLLIGKKIIALNNKVLVAEGNNEQIMIGIDTFAKVLNSDLTNVVKECQASKQQIITNVDIQDTELSILVTISSNNDTIAQWESITTEDFAIVKNIINNSERIVKAII